MESNKIVGYHIIMNFYTGDIESVKEEFKYIKLGKNDEFLYNVWSYNKPRKDWHIKIMGYVQNPNKEQVLKKFNKDRLRLIEKYNTIFEKEKRSKHKYTCWAIVADEKLGILGGNYVAPEEEYVKYNRKIS